MEVSNACQKTLSDLSQGNPGAVRVLCEIVSIYGERALEKFIAAGIYGPDIWVGYKDFAKGSVAEFMKAVNDCDPEMFQIIKENR